MLVALVPTTTAADGSALCDMEECERLTQDVIRCVETLPNTHPWCQDLLDDLELVPCSNFVACHGYLERNASFVPAYRGAWSVGNDTVALWVALYDEHGPTGLARWEDEFGELPRDAARVLFREGDEAVTHHDQVIWAETWWAGNTAFDVAIGVVKAAAPFEDSFCRWVLGHSGCSNPWP